jgi:hypothetical protein
MRELRLCWMCGRSCIIISIGVISNEMWSVISTRENIRVVTSKCWRMESIYCIWRICKSQICRSRQFGNIILIQYKTNMIFLESAVFLLMIRVLTARVWGLSRKYTAILNISRTGRVALMYLGSQSEETLLCIREQSLSRGTSQSAVRRRWRNLCTVWLSHSQWPSEEISFITTMGLPILQLSCRLFFWQNITSARSVSPPTAQIWLPATFGFSLI